MRTLPWSRHRKDASIERGAHLSAKQHVAFLRQEFASMIKKGQWTVFPARLVRHMHKLRISPIGVVYQRDRRPRTIVDYSFCDVNEYTAPWAPYEAMQFGRALHRILRRILEAHPRFGPVHISKVDIDDGFYRVWLLPSDMPTLGVALPTTKGEEPMIGFPLALPMGWVNSPPYFTAATETIADLANAALVTTAKFPSHCLEAISETDPDSVADYQDPPSPSRAPPVSTAVPEDRIHEYSPRPVASHDVYVDDFLSLVQGGTRRRLQVKRSLLHALDSVFRGLDASDSLHRQEPASVKKISKEMGSGPPSSLSSAGSSIQSARRPSCHHIAWSAGRSSYRTSRAPSSASPPTNGSRSSESSAPCHLASRSQEGSSAPCNTRCASPRHDAFDSRRSSTTLWTTSGTWHERCRYAPHASAK
jgi:hypothetical protein